MLEFGGTANLFDVQKKGANYGDDGFIADIYTSAKVWVSYT